MNNHKIREGCYLIAVLLMAIGMIYLSIALRTSRSNEREMSRRYYQLIRNERLNP